mgnify:CR=1 FL=1
MPFNEDGSRKKGPFYKKSGFKMKGSPMQRNFGVGSPLHDEKEETKIEPKHIGTEEHGTWSSDVEGELGTIDVGKKKGYRRITDAEGNFVNYIPEMTPEELRIHRSRQ